MPLNELEILQQKVTDFLLSTLHFNPQTGVVVRTSLYGKTEYLLMHTPSDEILFIFDHKIWLGVEPFVHALGTRHSDYWAEVVLYKYV